MDKEFYDKYSKDLECSCCQDLQYCINGKEPLKINCAIHYFKDKITDLEAKLAEKEKEIEDFKDVSRRLISTCGKANCYGKNQIAVAELEKVIEFAKTQDEFGFRKSGMEIFMFVDQQIKSLKGETDGSTN